jgi:signal transduction histidine kinase
MESLDTISLMSEPPTAFDFLSEPTLPQFLTRLFTSDFMPHGHCFFWRPEILWLHVFSDFAIGLAYYLIPFALFKFVKRRKDLAFNWMFLLFGVFILACGTTHFMNIWTMWHGTYRLDGMVKLVTAMASILTAILLYPLIPKALALRSPAELEIQVRERTQELREANRNLKTLSRKLEDYNEEILNSNRELEQFAYVASHDLQEPLRTVSNFVDLLAQKGSDKFSDVEKEYIQFALEGAERAQLLIQDLLDFSRVGGKGKALVKTDMTNVVHDAVLNLQTKIEDTRAEIRSTPLPTIYAEPSQMLQVFQNLLSNALKYRSERPLVIEISAEERPEEWVFSVADNGIGIDPEFHDKVFALFKRLHSQKDYEGTGIGLAICKKITDCHRGRIWIESELGKGARFRFAIPKIISPDDSNQDNDLSFF